MTLERIKAKYKLVLANTDQLIEIKRRIAQKLNEVEDLELEASDLELSTAEIELEAARLLVELLQGDGK